MTDFVAWPYTENVASLLVSDPVAVLRALDSPVLATEKLDGSNLAIRISRADADSPWALVSLQGRNSVLWAPAGGPMPMGGTASAGSGKRRPGQGVPNLSYGNAKALAALPQHMFNFSVRVAQRLPVPSPPLELMVFGEAFRTVAEVRAADGAAPVVKQQPLASFHPFGVHVLRDAAVSAAAATAENATPPAEGEPAAAADPALPTGDGDGDGRDGDGDEGNHDAPVFDQRVWFALTPELHALFTLCAENGGADQVTGEAAGEGTRGVGVGGGPDFHERLIQATTHLVLPPPVVYAGPLAGAGAALQDWLLHAPPFVEGVFFSGGFFGKWKTPMFEEQSSAPDLAELGLQLREVQASGAVLPTRAKVLQALGDVDDAALEALAGTVPGPLAALFLSVTAVLKRRTAKTVLKVTKADSGGGGGKGGGGGDVAGAALRARIATAFRREFTKDPGLQQLDAAAPKDRKPIADRVVANVVTEVQRQMGDDGEQPPAPAALKKEVAQHVMGPIMKNDLSTLLSEGSA